MKEISSSNLGVLKSFFCIYSDMSHIDLEKLNFTTDIVCVLVAIFYAGYALIFKPWSVRLFPNH